MKAKLPYNGKEILGSGTKEIKEKRTLFLQDVVPPGQPCQETPFTRISCPSHMSVRPISSLSENPSQGLNSADKSLKGPGFDLAKTIEPM